MRGVSVRKNQNVHNRIVLLSRQVRENTCAHVGLTILFAPVFIRKNLLISM